MPEIERYTIRVPESNFRMIRERRGHRNIYVSLEDLITWAYKGIAANDHPDVKTTFQVIVSQMEHDLREQY